MLKHLAIIPDGNRRWATAKNLVTGDGHAKGAERFTEISNAAFETGVQYFTFWAASADNLTKRSEAEISILIKLLKEQLRKEIAEKRYAKLEIKFRVIGGWRELISDPEVHELITQLEKETKLFTNHTLTILLGYDGKQEMLEAIADLVDHEEVISEPNLRSRLATHMLPDVDLVVRTGGEPHWSAGFMMWLTANSQFYFTETLWPDFKADHLSEAVAEYNRRERRLGA